MFALTALTLVMPLAVAPPARRAMREFERSECEAQIRDTPEQGDGYSCMYAYARASGEYDAVEQRLSELVAEMPSNPWPRVKLASVLSDRGKPGAIELLREGIALFSPEEAPYAALAQLNLATLLRHRDEDDLAAAELAKARQTAVQSGDEQLLLITTIELARHKAFNGGSLTEVGRLLDEIGEVPDELYQAKVNLLHTRASWLWRTGRVEEAAATRRQLIEHATKHGDDYVAAASLLAVAGNEDWLARLSLNPSVEDYRNKLIAAREAAARAQHSFVEAEALCLLADVENDEALDNARACVRVAEKAGDAAWLVFGQAALAAALRRSGDIAGAQALAAKAADAAADLADPELEAIIAEEEIRLAWAAQPRSKAIETSLGVLDRLDGIVIGEAPDVDAERRATWRTPYAIAIGELLRSDSRTAADISTALWVAERQRLDDIFAPKQAAPDESRRLEDLQASLGPGHAVAEFFVANDRDYKSSDRLGSAWAWIVTHDEVQVRRLPEHRFIAAKALALAGAAAAGDTNLTEAASSLAEELLGDASGAAERWTIIADQELFELPFSLVLPDARVDHATSITALATRPERPAPTERARVTAFGDPARHASQPRFAVDDVPLPHARAEARAVVKAFGDSGAALLGDAATKSALVAAAADSGILHIAAHAVINSADPSRTGLLLAPSEADDGTLTLDELRTLEVNADLVVLSACESLAGPFAPGRGLHGLGQAFLRQGATAVVGTLWPIRDDQARIFFEAIYADLAGGGSVSGAVMRAQHDAAARGAPPQLWASVVVLGDGSLRLAPAAPPAEDPSNPRAPWSWAILAIGVAAGWVAFKKMKRA